MEGFSLSVEELGKGEEDKAWKSDGQRGNEEEGRRGRIDTKNTDEG